MSGSIRISKKHGVNPSLLSCFICGKDAGVALFGRMKGDEEAPRKTTKPGIHCTECEEVLNNGGHMLIEVQDGTDQNNPYRTGKVWGIKEEAWLRLGMDPKFPIAYLEESAARNIGLKKGGTHEEAAGRG